MKITQEEAYEFMKTLPKALTEGQVDAIQTPLQVQLDPRSGTVHLSFKHKGDISIPIYLKTLYSNGVRKPLQVSSLYIWQVVNEGIERYYKQNQRTQVLNLSQFSLLITYVVPESDTVMNGLKDGTTLGYVFVNDRDEVLSLLDTKGKITAWVDKQPVNVSEAQMQYRLKQVIQQQDRGSTVLDDLLAEEMNNFGY